MSKKKTGLIFITALITCFYFFDLGYLVKAVKVGYLKGHTTAYLSDYVHFDNDIIETGVHQPWSIPFMYPSIMALPNIALTKLFAIENEFEIESWSYPK